MLPANLSELDTGSTSYFKYNEKMVRYDQEGLHGLTEKITQLVEISKRTAESNEKMAQEGNRTTVVNTPNPPDSRVNNNRN